MTEANANLHPQFNLIEDPWIRCIDTSARAITVSITELFANADNIVRLAGESPTQDMAVLRTLLVIFWRAQQNSPQILSGDAEDRSDWWLELFRGSGDLSTPVLEYLPQHHQRFDLFHPTTPFMQVADLATEKGTYDDLGKLIPDSESTYFSMRTGSGLDTLEFDEAARWLLHYQSWNYAGIKPGVIGDDRVKGGKSYSVGAGWSGRSGGVVLHGDNMRQTLLLNTNPDKVFFEDPRFDVPVWERPPDRPGTTRRERSTGPSDLLTWQIRRVRLFTADDKVVGILATNGDKLDLRNHFNDPMTAYRYSKPQSTKTQTVFMPKTHNASRTMWRGIEPLLIREGVEEGSEDTQDRQPATVAWLHEMKESPDEIFEDMVVGAELIGQAYGPQDSIYTETIHEELPMRLAVLTESGASAAHMLISTAKATMDAAIAIGQFAGTLTEASGGDYTFGTNETEAVLEQLNEPFKRWLATYSTQDDITVLRQRWFDYAHRTMLHYAQELVRGAGPSALLGREIDDRVVSAAIAWSALMTKLNKHLNQRAASESPKAGPRNLRKATP